MKPLEFIKKRLLSVLPPEEVERERNPKDYQFVPVQLPNGSIAQIGKKVDVKPIEYPFNHYTSDWALATGNVDSLTPFPPSILDVMDRIVDETLNSDLENINDKN